MALNDTNLINITFLENRLGELNLKNWWVAEAIGVDRKTVGRWLSGKVKTIKSENLQALASCLKCDPQDLVLKDESAILVSKEEQAIAAQLIVQEDLLATLTPLGQWPLLESIVKATLQPNLPIPVMGKLYNLLSICSWRQSKMDKAQAFADKALELGHKVGHMGVKAQARNNLAIIFSYQGKLKDAIALYESVVRERQFIEEDRTVAAALSNLAQDYQSYGDFEKSRKIQLEAITLYSTLALPLNLSIAHCALGLLETEVGNFKEAQAALEKSLELAYTANYLRGISAHKIYLADCLAQMGDLDKAEVLLSEGFRGMAELNLHEALNYEIRARFFRLKKMYQKAQADLAQGFIYAKDFPMEEASLLMEQECLSLAMKDGDTGREALQKALRIYATAGAELRASRQRKVFL